MKEYIYTLDFLHEHKTGKCIKIDNQNDKGIVVNNVIKEPVGGYIFEYEGKKYNTVYRWALIENTLSNMFIYKMMMEEQNKIEQSRNKYQELLDLITSTEIE